MWRRRATISAVLACAVLTTPLAAQDVEPVEQPLEDALTTGVLTPEAVLRSSVLTFPSILESFQREAAARSDQLVADGAFDLIFEGEAYDRVTGTFSGGYAQLGARQPLAPMGAEVYGSYRLSDGRFPIYENFYNTNQAGEFKVGGLLSLLRNRRIDQRRFDIEDTQLAADQAALDIVLVKLKVQHEALAAYWRWVATGREIAVYEELLEIAQARAVGLARQVRSGAMPRIAITENEQNLIRRKALLAEARRNFTMAATALSFYLRSPAGEMIVPSQAQLPNSDELGALPDMQSLISVPHSEILRIRPELRNFRLAIQRAENKIELRRNDMQPQLDFKVELSRDFGAIGDGGPTFDSTDTTVGVTFTVPLQRRQAQGRLQRAEAELREVELREQRISDQIEVELDNILTNLSAALDLADLADAEVEQAKAMVSAERRRFSLGAGDFFLVNLREEAAADARIRAIRADLNGRIAAASYSAATMNLAELGLD